MQNPTFFGDWTINSTGKVTEMIMAIFGPNMVTMYSNNIFNSLIIFLLHFGTIKSQFHYLEAQNSKFHDFFIFGPTINGFYWPINGLIGQ